MTAGTRGREKRFCSLECSRASRRKRPKETACWYCGATLVQSEGAGFPKRYCDRQCAQALRIQQEKAARDLNAVCLVCSAEFVGARARMKYCGEACRAEANRRRAAETWRKDGGTRPMFKERECGWCKDANNLIILPVSYTGSKTYHDECKLRARRAHYRNKTLLRQGVKSKQIITHEEIAERDGFRCHICEEPVDMALPRTSRLGATLDHVIPISRGGVDSRDNLKLAHWICNIKKSNKTGEDFVASKA